MLVRNPFFKKIELAESDEKSASYGGIALKSLWFWLLTFAGMAVYFFVPLPTEINTVMIACLTTGIIVVAICPLLTYFFPLTAPVTGSLYSIVQGFILAMLCKVFLQEYGAFIWIAIGITALIFIIMLILYFFVKPNKKFAAVALAIFIASIIGSAAIFISSFFTTALTNLFWGNGPIAIIVAALALLFAAVNLVFEFDFTKNIVKDGAKKNTNGYPLMDFL